MCELLWLCMQVKYGLFPHLRDFETLRYFNIMPYMYWVKLYKQCSVDVNYINVYNMLTIVIDHYSYKTKLCSLLTLFEFFHYPKISK